MDEPVLPPAGDPPAAASPPHRRLEGRRLAWTLAGLAGATYLLTAGTLGFVWARCGLTEQGVGDDVPYVEYVKSAYHQSDVDTLRVIRMIAESGRIQ